MRIALITGYYPPPYNANAVRAMYMARELARSGFEVYVVPLLGTKSSSGFFGERIVSLSRSVAGSGSFYRKPSLARRIIDVLSSRRVAEEVITALRDASPEIVIATLPPVEAIPLGYEIAKRFRARFVADIQDLADEYRVLSRPWLAPAIRAYFRRVYGAVARADLVSVTTEFMQRVLAEKHGVRAPMIVVPNGVDNEFYSKCFEKRVRGSSREAVFLGDLNFAYHKLDVFIEALKLAAEEGLDLRLRVVGEGSELPKLRELAERLGVMDRVEFRGHVPREALVEELSCGAFGLAGRPAIDNLWIVTTMRMTVYEYLSCGLPVLAYGPPNSYTQHFVESNGVGIYVPSNDPRHLLDGAKRLLKIVESEGEEISRRCREVALRYEWSSVMRVLARRCLELLERGSG